MVESEYSIKDLEQLVQAGTMKKKIVKSTYTREFMSRAINCLKVGSIMGAGMTALLIPPVAFATPDAKYSDIINLALMNFGMFTGFTTFMLAGTAGFYKWRERSRPYVEAGGKIVYKKPGIRKEQFILPLNHKFNREEKLDFDLQFNGYIDDCTEYFIN